jgi:hypothetical protein
MRGQEINLQVPEHLPAPERIRRIDDFATRQNATDAWDLASDLSAITWLVGMFGYLAHFGATITDEDQNRITARFPELRHYRFVLRGLLDSAGEVSTEEDKQRFCGLSAALSTLLEGAAGLITAKANVLQMMGVNETVFAEGRHKAISFGTLLKVRPRQSPWQPFEFQGGCSRAVEEIGAAATRLAGLLAAAPVVALRRPGPESRGTDRPPDGPVGRHAPDAGSGGALPDGRAGTVPTSPPPVKDVATSAIQSGGAACIPRWDRENRELWYGDTLCWKYEREAPKQMELLDEFEKQGWPESLTHPGKHRSWRQTVVDMMKHKGTKSPVVFGTRKNGKQVYWKVRG